MVIRVDLIKPPICQFEGCADMAVAGWSWDEHNTLYVCDAHDRHISKREKQAMDTCSIIMSNYKRLEYLKRTLFSIVNNYWAKKYELVIAEEISDETDSILTELHRYDKVLNWTCVLYDMDEFTKHTGIHKFFNNPSLGNNIAFNHSKGDLIFHQGNDTIVLNGTYNQLIQQYYEANSLHTIVYSSTVDMPQYLLRTIGQYGELLSMEHLENCHTVFQSPHMQSMVTNYLSLCHRESWKALNGYDLNYLKGIAAEDSSFSLRFRHLPNAKWIFSTGLSIHQNHRNQTPTSIGDAKIITEQRWKAGCDINGTYYKSQSLTKTPEMGLNCSNIGLKEVIKNEI